MDRKDTLILIGKSPVLDDPEIMQKAKSVHLYYTTIGINNACYLYDTEYLAFVDSASTVYYSIIHPNTKILTLPNYATEKFQGEFYDLFIPQDNELPVKDKHLAYNGFTHDMCLSWAYLKGYKNIILMGVADFTQDKGYNKACETMPFGKSGIQFNPSDLLKKQSVNYINNTMSKLLNMYTVNPKSVLNVNKISIEEF